MPKLIVTDRGGAEKIVEGKVGESVMEVLKEHGFNEILALCGGCAACATCHVYVDPQWRGALVPMSDDENDLLSGSDHRNGSSRLSCQIPFSDALDGLHVTIAPED